ncbi:MULTISPECIES: DEAD/DEAH box helicase family protein, partial [unclassified Anaerobiospirillum]|uniref:restriction endonuclease n=1 Tax=unclassified Anaerobiospirillum TaxID=2647410 RepID=UPI001FF0FA3E
MSINETRDKAEAQEPDNIQAFYDLLEWIDKISPGPRDKGTRFENLILDYLRNEPTYKDLFTEVQTWAQWAKAHPEFDYDANDIGIDLVATDAAPGEHGQVTYSAIQCKFYAKDAVVPKAELDSFLSASNTGWCKCRYVFATNSNWSANLKKELEKQFIPVEIVAREALANSVIDWAVYHKTGKVVINRRTLRPYQQDALKDVIEGLKTNDRGKLIMACGTGKTFTSLKIAEKQTGENGF